MFTVNLILLSNFSLKKKIKKRKQDFGEKCRIICVRLLHFNHFVENGRGIVLLKEIAIAFFIPIQLWLLAECYQYLKEYKERRFCTAREIARVSRPQLTDKIIRHYSLVQEDSILLHPKDYCFLKPVPIDNVKLIFDSNDDSVKQIVRNFEKLFQKFWPHKCKIYSDAVYRMEDPDRTKFYNGRSYRLLDVQGTNSLRNEIFPGFVFSVF
ncbi:MAG: hypothetical protein PHI24_12520 [Desulfitobacteriaceae bacterium]|nr:hypothetical protein [Desulfitobacteriaceae bacterium]